MADLKATPDGYITKGIGGFYYVRTEKSVVECRARGIFRKRGISPVAGDHVLLGMDGTIDEILPRKNLFVRPPIANLDVLFVVASTVQPVPSTLILDKLIATAVYQQVQPVLVITKTDLGAADTLAKAYEKSGIPTVLLHYETGEGMEQIKEWICGRLCAFCGNSGVGKSTLLNRIAPDLQRQTAAISQKLGRGRHTTREVEIFEVCGGRIADTPGFASIETEKLCWIPKEELQHAFPEFEPYFGQCKFTGCSHRTEKGCAVRQALAENKISPTRYASYLAMYEEASQVKEWENSKGRS
jgi:ribosome biogenesis GTPase